MKYFASCSFGKDSIAKDSSQTFKTRGQTVAGFEERFALEDLQIKIGG